MRVLHVAFHFAEYSLNLCEALSHEHQVAAVFSRANVADELTQAPAGNERLAVLTLPDHQLKHPGTLINTMRLAAFLRMSAPDVIHCQEGPRDYMMALLPFLGRFPLVVTVHDHLPHAGRDSRRRWRIERYRQWMRQRADAIIVHGEKIRHETESLLPDHRGRVHSVPHGPIGQIGEEASDPGMSWIPGELLFFGRIEAYKGLGCLLDAADILAQRGLRFRVTIAGRGDDLPNHRERILRTAHCRLLDQRVPPGDVAALFRDANIVVLPYQQATQSGVAAMALRFARPTVASDIGAVAELVRPDQNGLLVPPGNALALADAIELMLRNEDVAKRCAREARRLADNELSWRRIAVETTRVYNRAIQYRRDRRAR